MPLSSIVRSSLPAPWASSSAACAAATDMKPFPPRAATARCRAEASGSSGRGNGMRSITTSCSDRPGTSTPCQSDRVPNRQLASSKMNCRSSSPVASSPWHSRGWLICPRSSSAACRAARMDENSPNVRPPAASMSSRSSAR